MALKILIPGIDFPINNPEKLDSTAPMMESQPPIRPAVQASKESQAREEVSAIESQALALGWERDQLAELARILKTFMPCKVGSVRREAIGILLLDADGEIRGGNRFYNMRVPQPWIKRADIPPTG